jgi:serine/threonine protein kinase
MGSVQCAACGTAVNATLLFCTACGSRVGAAAPSDTEQDIAPALLAAATAPRSEVPTRVEIPALTGTGEVRRYRDGVLVSADGARVEEVPAGQAPLPLPYASTDVLRRLGPYDLLSELGRGDTGVVYTAFSRPQAKPCAVKVMIAGEHATGADIQRFREAVARVAELEHPNIVTVFDAGEDRGRAYFASRFVEGRSLRDLMREVHRTRTASALEEAVRALAKAARVLQFAHDAGFVHCDIKPGNIIIDGEGESHLTDFGIAKQRRAEKAPLAAGATIVGTPSYMSPEQASGSAALISPLSDVFSLGAVLYDLCTGRPPFVGEGSNNTILTMASLLGHAPEPASKVAARQLGWSLAPELEAICHRAIAQDPPARYASAAAFALDLEAWLNRPPISVRSARAQPTPRRSAGTKADRKLAARVALAAVLALATGFTLVVATARTDTRQAVRALGIDAALAQATTLRSAIEQHMLQGRPDLSRALVDSLRAARNTGGIDVLRTDRSFAFTDQATRFAVEARLGDASALSWASERWPELPAVVRAFREVALPAIARAPERKAATFEFDPRAWEAFLARGEALAYDVDVAGEPTLTVLQPVPNDAKCQACHGDTEQGVYGMKNAVRAVLVVRRSRAVLEQRLRAGNVTALGIGAGTLLVLLGLLWFAVRRSGVLGRPSSEPPSA